MLYSMKYIKILTVGHSNSVRTPGDGFPDGELAHVANCVFMNTAAVDQQGVP